MDDIRIYEESKIGIIYLHVGLTYILILTNILNLTCFNHHILNNIIFPYITFNINIEISLRIKLPLSTTLLP